MEEERVTLQGSKRSLPAPADEPAVVAAPPVPPLGHAFNDGYAILALPAPSTYGSVLGNDDEDGEAYDDMRDDDNSIDSDSDGEFEDHADRVRFWDGDAAAGSETEDLIAGRLTFLGRPTRFASFQGAAGFMRLYAAQAVASGAGVEEDHEGREVIIVHYRLTRFSRSRQSDDAHDVEVRDFGTSLHHVRYLVPFPVAAADPAGSLRLVGAALAADVYPYRHYVQLQALWSGLVAALPVRVPARATHLVVTVDVGVLRRSVDRTPVRMARMREALAAVARENDDAPPMACGLEQHLPAPVCMCCNDESSSDGEVPRRPAKRRRFDDEGDVCGICLGTLEHGIAAWPRCSHVFHGKCLEKLLVMVKHRCPMCRSTLSSKGMFG